MEPNAEASRETGTVRLFNKDQLRLLITDSCNLTCTYCHNEGQFGKGHYISLDAIDSLAGWLRRERVFVKSLVISGGEPTVHPRLLEIVHRLRDSAVAISMVTNGVKLDPARIDALAAAGMSYVKFGIDAVDALDPTKGPLRKTPRGDNAATVLSNALYANEVMPGSHLNTVISSYNFEKLRRIIKWCDSNRIGAKFLELIEVRDEIRAINPNPTSTEHSWFGSLYSMCSDLIGDVEYNPKVMKFFAKTQSGQVLQFSENFCIFGGCGNLWTRMDSRARLIPCIHKPITHPFSFDPSAVDQVRRVNAEMRDYASWPCGAHELQTQIEEGAFTASVRLPNNQIEKFALTSKSTCVG